MSTCQVVGKRLNPIGTTRNKTVASTCHIICHDEFQKSASRRRVNGQSQKKDIANFGFNMRYDILMEGEDRPAGPGNHVCGLNKIIPDWKRNS